MKKMLKIFLIFILLFPFVEVKAADSIISVCGFDYVPAQIPKIVSNLYNVVKVLVPVFLIVLGMLDFTKAMMSNSQDKMKKNQNRFIVRIIAGIIVYLVMAIVQFVFNQIDVSRYNTEFSKCLNCFFNNNCGAVLKKEQKIIVCDELKGLNCFGTDSNGNSCRRVTVYGVKICRTDCTSLNAEYLCSNYKYCEWSKSDNKCKQKLQKISISPSVNSNSKGKQVAEYAKKFVGHPYVYGGIRLCEDWKGKSGCGVDCATFTKFVYKKFGYELPEGAHIQSTYKKGKRIEKEDFGENYENLRPGDLLFYTKDGTSNSGIGHVSMYIGDGKIVHASSPSIGVIIANASYRKTAWAMRIIN